MHSITQKKPDLLGDDNISSVLGLNNSFEAKYVRFICLSLVSFQLGHHRIVTDSKQYNPFVPHSHANLHFCAI